MRFERFELSIKWAPGIPSPLDHANKNSHVLTVRNSRTRNFDRFTVWSETRKKKVSDDKELLRMFGRLIVAGRYGSLPVMRFCEEMGLDPMKPASIRAHINLRDKADRLASLFSSRSGIIGAEGDILMPDGSVMASPGHLINELKKLGVVV